MMARRLGWLARVEGHKGDERHGRHGAWVIGNGSHGGSALDRPKSEGEQVGSGWERGGPSSAAPLQQ
jgi:hypothetical protein